MAVVSSSGDGGSNLDFGQWPQGLPTVTSAGGTSLYPDSSSSRGYTEVAWNGAGSGCSTDLPPAVGQPTSISDYCNGHRAASDISAVADPYTGVAVYDSYSPFFADPLGYIVVGGTSVASPLIAGLWARAGVAPSTLGPNTIYAAGAGAFNDVMLGTNFGLGQCATLGIANPVCDAGPGWDGPTGRGTPRGLEHLPALTARAVRGGAGSMQSDPAPRAHRPRVAPIARSTVAVHRPRFAPSVLVGMPHGDNASVTDTDSAPAGAQPPHRDPTTDRPTGLVGAARAPGADRQRRTCASCSPPTRERGETLHRAGLRASTSTTPRTASPPTPCALLLQLADESGLRERIDAMFAGEKINITEDRAVLHVALRAPRGEHIEVDGVDVVPAVHEVLGRMAEFADRIRAGKWLGHTGQPIRNIVNIGIGGSDLGPVMAYEALRHYTQRELTFRFVSNVDGTDFAEATRDLDPAETLFIVSSKTFTTLETMTNADTARDWILAALERRSRRSPSTSWRCRPTPTRSASSASTS